MTKVISTSKLAANLGITPQRVLQLNKSGLLERARRNQWDQWLNVERYAAYKSGSKHAGRPSVGERSDDLGCEASQSIFSF